MKHSNPGLPHLEDPGENPAPPKPTRNGGAITHYVRALAEGYDAAGTLFNEAWEALRQMLRAELNQRSLWTSPPSYVGVYNAQSWTDSGPTDRSMGPLDEFLQECFTAILIERIPQLLARLEVHSTIEGDVRLYVRNFVHDRQRDHDPLGFRLYELLRSAVLDALDARELFVLQGDRSIRNMTVLSFRERSPEPPAEDLQALASGWAQGAVADLFSLGPGSRQRAVDRLRTQLVALRSHVTAFRFKAVLDGLKYDVRAQLATLFDIDRGETVLEVDEDGRRNWIRSLQPETWVEDMDSYRKLVACVSEFVVRAEERAKTRRHLERLWGFLRRFATSAEDVPPSRRMLAKLLEIPRGHLPKLFELLGGFVQRCSQHAGNKVVTGRFQDHPTPPGDRGPVEHGPREGAPEEDVPGEDHDG